MGNKSSREEDKNPRPKSAPSVKTQAPQRHSDPGTKRTDSDSNVAAKKRQPSETSSRSKKSSFNKTEDKSSDKPNAVIIEIENKKANKLMVAAIDFGTTYSGYAYMFKSEYGIKKDSAIHCPNWIREGGISFKAPTSVLFKPNKAFHSFGYDAEKFYNENSNNQDFKEWYFFKQFKMKLYTEKNQLTKDTLIEDNRECGNRMKAVDVFAAVIDYFKNHLLKSTEIRLNSILKNEDIHWIITVPAIWDLKAKQFMKDAAEKAGITNDQLTLALEPEAASLYCRLAPVAVETTKDGGKVIASMQKGSKYIVFDQGGGTTDITIHEVMGPNTLKEIHQACGGHYGGTTVNQEFFKFLSRLFGGNVMHKIREQHPSAYFELMDSFELKKVSFEEKEHSIVTIRVPYIWMEVFEDITEEKLAESLKMNSTFKDKVTVHNDKLRIDVKTFRSFFDFSIHNVLKTFENLFQKPEIANITTLLAVGGYSESPVLINAIKEKFPRLTVIVPKDPVLAVLKGAVLYGFEPNSITERVSQYTYGVAMQLPFDPSKHDFDKKSSVKDGRGRDMVDDVFDKHIEIGKVAKIGEFEDEHDYFPLVEQHVGHFEFFASTDKNPKYTDDPSCQLIGFLSFPLSKQGKVFLKLNASGTEVIAVVREQATGQESRAYFSLF